MGKTIYQLIALDPITEELHHYIGDTYYNKEDAQRECDYYATTSHRWLYKVKETELETRV